MSRLVGLDDPAAASAEIVGRKAAGLARARAAGMPVLPGLVVPIEAGTVASRVGCEALAERGRGAARGQVAGLAINPELATELDSAGVLGRSLVVRSSTSLDDDGTFAGAFASYGEVSPDELAVAVRGCWASVFAPATLDRLALAGIDAGAVGMAVLIQPHVQPRAGGWVEIDDRGIAIAAVAGHPGPLLGGWTTGFRITLQRGRLTDAVVAGEIPPEAPLGAAEVRALALLAERASVELGSNRLEWGFQEGDDRPVIFQVGTLATESALNDEDDDLRPDAFSGLGYRRLLALLVDRRGPLARRLVAPWAAAAPEVEPVAPSEGSSTAVLSDALVLVAAFTDAVTQATGLDPDQLIDRLAIGDLEVSDRLTEVVLDRGRVSRALADFHELGTRLTEAGLLPDARALWWQSDAWLHAALNGTGPATPAARRPVDSMTDLLLAVLAALGTAVPGQAASAGRAVGRASWVSGADAGLPFPTGNVLVVPMPVVDVAPLLWRASALVAVDGSPAAHLCEVARSLHLPAVVGVGPLDDVERAIVGVDGARGTIWTREAEGGAHGASSSSDRPR